jgi:PDZ domain-containing protein
VRRLRSPVALLALGLVVLAVILAGFVIPSNDYIFLPDPAHPVAPLVTVKGGRDTTAKTGGIYFVDVVVRKATLLEKLFGGLHEGADLYPASAVNPPGTNDQERRQIDLEDMAQSQQVAAAVAEKAAGRKVGLTQIGAQVYEVEAGKPADGKLEPDDVITAVNGTRVKSPTGVFNAMRKVTPGQTVGFTIRRDDVQKAVSLKTVAEGKGKARRAVVGVFLQTALDIHVPVPVRIDAGGVGGPSAGLAFALEVLKQLGRNVTHGHRVAATGEIFPDGSVGPIGGVKQKTIGARKAGVDAFLVPAGDNAQVARRYAHGLRILPVKSFQQALHALATLR